VPKICIKNSTAELYLIYKNGFLLWFSFNECITNQCHGHHKQEVAGVHKMQVDERTLILKHYKQYIVAGLMALLFSIQIKASTYTACLLREPSRKILKLLSHKHKV
jgi:hypothetical protein